LRKGTSLLKPLLIIQKTHLPTGVEYDFQSQSELPNKNSYHAITKQVNNWVKLAEKSVIM
jgi:hypothetical protein